MSRVDDGACIDADTLAAFLEGTLADVVGAHGKLSDHQVLVCGSPAMTRTTIERLRATGTPMDNIHYDPF